MKSYELKLSRADFHIRNAEAGLAAWSRDGYRVIKQPNAKGRFELLAEMLKDFPSELSLSVGDAFHCLRDSLDHIVFDLAVTHGVLSADEERKLMFPIPSKAAITDGDTRIQALDVGVRAKIVALLPNPAGKDFAGHPLVVLDKMNNRDKHRAISIVAAISAVQSLCIFESDGSDYFYSKGAVSPKLGEPPISFLEFSENPNVKAQVRFSTKIVFDKGTEAAGKEVVVLLREIHAHIRDAVIQALK